jgi:hypothetical protein
LKKGAASCFLLPASYTKVTLEQGDWHAGHQQAGGAGTR